MSIQSERGMLSKEELGREGSVYVWRSGPVARILNRIQWYRPVSISEGYGAAENIQD